MNIEIPLSDDEVIGHFCILLRKSGEEVALKIHNMTSELVVRSIIASMRQQGLWEAFLLAAALVMSVDVAARAEAEESIKH